VPDLSINVFGNANTSRLCQTFQSCCEINSLSIYIVFVSDYLAQIYAHTKCEVTIFGSLRVDGDEICLHGDCALNSILSLSEILQGTHRRYALRYARDTLQL